jgi:hypothetical protein
MKIRQKTITQRHVSICSGVSGAPTGSVVGNASSAAGGGGMSGAGVSGSNFGPHSDGGGDGYDPDGDKNDVESILLPNKHSWWNVIALCKKVFRSETLMSFFQ